MLSPGKKTEANWRQSKTLVQRRPDLFPVLRVLAVRKTNGTGPRFRGGQARPVDEIAS